MSHELHLTVLQHVGLTAALSSYCEEFSSREGITITLDIQEGIDAGFPAEAALEVRTERRRNHCETSPSI